MSIPDISAEISAFREAAYGEDVRSALISLAQKIRGVITSELATMEATWNEYQSGMDESFASLETTWTTYSENLDSSWETYKDNMNDSWEAYKEDVTDILNTKDFTIENYKQEFLATYKPITIALSDLPVFKRGYYDQNGNIVSYQTHHIVCFDASGICQLSFSSYKLMNNQYVGLIITDSDGNIIRQFIYDYLVQQNSTSSDQRTQRIPLPAKGLPNGSMIYMVHWYGGNMTDARAPGYIHEIVVSWYYNDDRFIYSKNLCDPHKAMSSGYFYYENGNWKTDARYDAWQIDTSINKNLAITGVAHAAGYDANGSYIRGKVCNDSDPLYEATANEKTVIVSVRNDVDRQIEYGLSKTAYLPWGMGFYSKSYENTTYFPIELNQSGVYNGINSNVLEDQENMETVYGVISLPDTYNPIGDPIPAIMITHGSTYYVADGDWYDSSTPFVNLRNAFLDAGYAIFDINGYKPGTHSTWGCPRVIRAYRKLYDYVTSRYNIQKQINIYGFSMGGIVGLNFMLRNRDIVKCACLASPVTNLYAQVWCYNAFRRTTCAESYEFDNWESLTFSDPITDAQRQIYFDNADKHLGYDIHAYIQNGVMDQSLPPFRIWHGTSDSSVSYDHSVTLINARRNANHDDTIRLVTGKGHEICYGANDICNQEYIMFFNRYNSK